MSRITDTIVPSLEHETFIDIKQESTEPDGVGLSGEDSPETLVGDGEQELLFDVSPVSYSTPDSRASTDLLDQLRSAAGSQPYQAGLPPPEVRADDDTSMATEEFLNASYDSDRTDFRESPSPSVRKPQQVMSRPTGKSSRRFQHSTSSREADPVRRLLFSAKVAKKTPKRKADLTGHAKLLQSLKELETHPRHPGWDKDEQSLLAIMYRWYDSDDASVIPKLFNEITGLHLRHNVIKRRFYNHMCFYGLKAIPELHRVYSVPFDDPQGCCTDIRELIEEQAIASGLALYVRDSEADIELGKAMRKKSPTTKAEYRRLIQKRKEEERGSAAALSIPHMSVSLRSNVSALGASRTHVADDEEVLTDSEELVPDPENVIAHAEEMIQDAEGALDISASPDLAPAEPQLLLASDNLDNPFETLEVPALGFRVWDEESRAQFSDDTGFVTEVSGSS